MIFIAVGTQKFPFDRLLKMVDILVKEGNITEAVFAQIGQSDYLPQNYSYERFLKKEDFENYIQECDLLITHSGVATIMSGLKYGKAVIVMPRLKKYGEHVDNHQVEIATTFAEKNFILMYEENVASLFELIEYAKMHTFEAYESKQSNVVEVLCNYINSIG